MICQSSLGLTKHPQRFLGSAYQVRFPTVFLVGVRFQGSYPSILPFRTFTKRGAPDVGPIVTVALLLVLGGFEPPTMTPAQGPPNVLLLWVLRALSVS